MEQGYLHGKVNGHEVGFENPPELDKNFRHDIDVRIDRLRCTKDRRQRLTESVEGALKLGGGTVAIESMEAPAEDEKLSEGTRSHFTKVGETVAWSEDFACPDHGAFMPELSPRVFSFNSPLGACSVCQGLGVERQFNVELIIDGTLTVANGCVRPWRQSMSPSWYRRLLEQVSQHYGISRNTPFELLDDDDKDILLNGSGSTIINFHFESDNGSVYKMNRPWEGIIARLQKTYTETTSERTRSRLISCMTDLDCSECGGEKLNAAARYVSVGGIRLPEVSRCSVHDSLALIRAWQPNGAGAPENFADVLEVLDERSLFIGKDILKEIENRLGFLDSVGLDYLTLDRKANTLSGGESQRITPCYSNRQQTHWSHVCARRAVNRPPPTGQRATPCNTP